MASSQTGSVSLNRQLSIGLGAQEVAPGEEEDLEEPLLAPAPTLKPGARFSVGDLMIALVGPLITVPDLVFYANVVFSGDLHSAGFLPAFIIFQFSTALNSSIFWFFSNLPMRVAVPDSVSGFFFFRMVGNIQQDLAAVNPDITPSNADIVSHTLVAMGCYSIIMGVLLVIVSWLRMTSFIHFIPYQVAGGFCAGCGLLMFISSVNLSSGMTSVLAVVRQCLALMGWSSVSDLDQEGSWVSCIQAMLCLFIGVGLWWAKERTNQHPAVVPFFFLGSTVVFYMVAIPWLGGHENITAAGWYLKEVAGPEIHEWIMMENTHVRHLVSLSRSSRANT